MNFEEQIQKKVQETILKQISDCRYIDYHHSDKRSIPAEVLENAWNNINWKEVTDFVSKELQSKVCQTIVQNMLTETKTDVKAILSVQGVREKLRMEAYPSIMKALGIEKK
jgi:hypothetical protein